MTRKSEPRGTGDAIVVVDSEGETLRSADRLFEQGVDRVMSPEGTGPPPTERAGQHGATGTALVDTTVVVLDTRQAFDVLAPMLNTAGYRALPAHTSAEAFDLFVRGHPHLLIVDDALLDASGTDLIHRLHALDPSVAVVAQCESLSAHQRRKIQRRLALHGIHDKADDPERLLELLDSAVDAVRRLERTRADQSLRGLILEKLCHDLRSCLHVVHGYTEVLCNDPAAAPLEAILSRLAVASETARELVQTYLDLAHLESPSVMIRRELVDIDALTAELAAQVGRQVGSRPVQLALSVPYPGAVVHTDGEKLRAILTQLLGTVVKLSRGGTIELGVCFAEDRTDFTITGGADGLGGAARQKFEPLSEACFATTPGQGLALAIAFRLSQLLGATLGGDRTANDAARFTLSLPVVALTGAGSVAPPTLH